MHGQLSLGIYFFSVDNKFFENKGALFHISSDFEFFGDKECGQDSVIVSNAKEILEIGSIKT